MDVVEINAGAWYLRALRCDDRVDDRPAILASCTDAEIRRWRRRPAPTLDAAAAYVADRAAGWARDERLTWAVSEPTTGELHGEVELFGLDLDRGLAEIGVWTLASARGRGLATTAVGAVLRFGFAGLGLHRIAYRWASGNASSQRLAARCGFVGEGRLRDAWLVDGRRMDVHLAARLATDR